MNLCEFHVFTKDHSPHVDNVGVCGGAALQGNAHLNLGCRLRSFVRRRLGRQEAGYETSNAYTELYMLL